MMSFWPSAIYIYIAIHISELQSVNKYLMFATTLRGLVI